MMSIARAAFIILFGLMFFGWVAYNCYVDKLLEDMED
jgi:hypothetical protein